MEVGYVRQKDFLGVEEIWHQKQTEFWGLKRPDTIPCKAR